MKLIGKTYDSENVYEINNRYAITQFGEVLGRNDGGYYTLDDNIVSTINDINSKTKLDDVLSKIINLEQLFCDGFEIDLIDSFIDREQFYLGDDENEFNGDELNYEILKFRGVEIKIYDDGSVECLGENLKKYNEANSDTKKRIAAIIKASGYMELEERSYIKLS